MTQNKLSSTTRLLNFFSKQPINFSRFYARVLAFIVNLLKITKTSQTITRNIEICLPELSEQRRAQITRAAVRNELLSYMEFFSIWGSQSEKNISRIRHIEGEALFHDAIARGKGLILIIPHFGTWEIMNSWLTHHSKLTIMYKPIKNNEADQFVRAARSREQANLVPTDESGIRQLFRALRQGGTTVILPDHSPKTGGDLVPYFGIPLLSSCLSAKLIQKTKASALFLYAMRNDEGGFDMTIEAMDQTIYTQSPEQGTELIHRHIEALIRQYPEHYHWSYKRFKANPALASIYQVNSAQVQATIAELRHNAQQPKA